MMFDRKLLAMFLLVLSTTIASAFADTIVLKDGRRIDGHVAGVLNKQTLVVNTPGSDRNVIRIPLDSVDFAQSSVPANVPGSAGYSEPPTFKTAIISFTTSQWYHDAPSKTEGTKFCYIDMERQMKLIEEKSVRVVGNKRVSESHTGRLFKDRQLFAFDYQKKTAQIVGGFGFGAEDADPFNR